MSPQLLKYLVAHCSGTHPNFNLTKSILDSWHMGPKDIKDGGHIIKIRYKGQDYPSRDLLPAEYINGKPVNILHGRGWDRDGYTDMLARDGKIINVTPYNKDSIVDPNEITWGATGVNAFSRHICLVGGRNDDNESRMFNFHDIFTDAQFTTFVGYVEQFLKDHANTMIAAHYDFSNKTCPNFNVYNLLKDAGVDPARLYLQAA